jgi:hypothetical protein
MNVTSATTASVSKFIDLIIEVAKDPKDVLANLENINKSLALSEQLKLDVKEALATIDKAKKDKQANDQLLEKVNNITAANTEILRDAESTLLEAKAETERLTAAKKVHLENVRLQEAKDRISDAREKDTINKNSKAENYLAQAEETKEKVVALQQKLACKLQLINAE